MTDQTPQPEKHSSAWQISKHEAYVLWWKWWPVAVLGLCDVLNNQAGDLQASKTASCVRIGVLLAGVISCVRVWAMNNKNKPIQ